jgi:hypothetical protein
MICRCSAGVSCSKLLSKLVSGLHKPDDQTVILPTQAQVRRVTVRPSRRNQFLPCATWLALLSVTCAMCQFACKPEACAD